MLMGCKMPETEKKSSLDGALLSIQNLHVWYELKRFGGYEELVPVAIEAKKPTEGAIKLMNSYLDKSRNMRDEAKKKAESGNYPVAIRMMQDATKTVRLALRMVGVM